MTDGYVSISFLTRKGCEVGARLVRLGRSQVMFEISTAGLVLHACHECYLDLAQRRPRSRPRRVNAATPRTYVSNR